MGYFFRRRVRNFGAVLFVLGAVWLWVRAQERQLHSSSFTTGYLMLAAIIFLALYNVRKRLPFLPLGNSATWLQWHLYVAMGSIGVFALHVGPKWPNGVLESALAVVYGLTVGSGVVGLYLTRIVPGQLTRVGHEVIYEQIPTLSAQVGRQAGAVVIEGVAASGATTLADFYVGRMYDFFQRPRGLRYLLWPTTAVRRSLMRELSDLQRYLADQEQPAYERLFALMRRKDDLDFHQARQKLLKTWLFVHIGLTYVLILLAMIHGLLAHAFGGGAA
jgi:hypothetical protein